MWTKEQCRKTYNRFLEEYNNGEHDYLMLQALLPIWKQTDKDLEVVYAKVLQYEVRRLFANLSALEEMRRRGRRVGKLRFKEERWFKTFTYNQLGFKLLTRNDKFGLLHLSKIGDIPIRLHRKVDGKIKQVTIKQMTSGKWYAYLIVDDGRSLPKINVVEKASALMSA